MYHADHEELPSGNRGSSSSDGGRNSGIIFEMGRLCRFFGDIRIHRGISLNTSRLGDGASSFDDPVSVAGRQRIL